MLILPEVLAEEMVAHCLRGLPDEACGLVVGDLRSGDVDRLFLSDNLAHSAKVYTLDPRVLLRADREAENRGLSVLGVFHSHTHTDAYPSPTDVAQAPDPTWHYVIVSLRDRMPAIRSYLIVGDEVVEEEIILTEETPFVDADR